MNCPSRTDDAESKHPTWNQNPPCLAADLTTCQDLNGIANSRLHREGKDGDDKGCLWPDAVDKMEHLVGPPQAAGIPAPMARYLSFGAVDSFAIVSVADVPSEIPSAISCPLTGTIDVCLGCTSPPRTAAGGDGCTRLPGPLVFHAPAASSVWSWIAWGFSVTVSSILLSAVERYRDRDLLHAGKFCSG